MEPATNILGSKFATRVPRPTLKRSFKRRHVRGMRGLFGLSGLELSRYANSVPADHNRYRRQHHRPALYERLDSFAHLDTRMPRKVALKGECIYVLFSRSASGIKTSAPGRFVKRLQQAGI